MFRVGLVELADRPFVLCVLIEPVKDACWVSKVVRFVGVVGTEADS